MNELPLRDIHLPDPISWWPPAIGWWLLFGLAVSLVTFVAFLIWRSLRPTLKKHAIKALSNIEGTFRNTNDASTCIKELSALMRRIVLSQNNFSKTAGITGKAWLELLDQQLDIPEFSQGVGQILLTGPYQPHVETEKVSQLIQLCQKWVDRL